MYTYGFYHYNYEPKCTKEGGHVVARITEWRVRSGFNRNKSSRKSWFKDVERLVIHEQGHLDIVVGNWLSPPEHLHISPLFDDEVVCMLGANPMACAVASALRYSRYHTASAARHVASCSQLQPAFSP